MAIKLMPSVVTLVGKHEIKNSGSTSYIKYNVAIDDTYHWIASFGGVATYIKNMDIGSRIFIEDWVLKTNDKYIDIVATKLRKVGG